MNKQTIIIIIVILLSIGCSSSSSLSTPQSIEINPQKTIILPEEPTPTPQPPVTISGNGDQVVNMSLSTGAIIVKGTHKGQGNFSARVYRLDGSLVAIPVNCLDTCTTSKVLSLNDNADYLVDVNAGGEWSITFSIP